MANSNHNDTVLSYDELGFIIGMKRVEKKVSTIDSNIEKIIGILTQSFEEQKAQFAQPQPKLTEFQKMLNAVNNRQALDFEDLFSVHDKFHRTLILSGFCLLKIAKISLNSSFFPKPIKR
ncbi:hypothetical protein A7A41_00480 [Acinetobacter baumannii]|nr:hypothetical protein A7A41_00480 [Acinetobacter baumannii]